MGTHGVLTLGRVDTIFSIGSAHSNLHKIGTLYSHIGWAHHILHRMDIMSTL